MEVVVADVTGEAQVKAMVEHIVREPGRLESYVVLSC